MSSSTSSSNKILEAYFLQRVIKDNNKRFKSLLDINDITAYFEKNIESLNKKKKNKKEPDSAVLAFYKFLSKERLLLILLDYIYLYKDKFIGDRFKDLATPKKSENFKNSKKEEFFNILKKDYNTIGSASYNEVILYKELRVLVNDRNKFDELYDKLYLTINDVNTSKSGSTAATTTTTLSILSYKKEKEEKERSKKDQQITDFYNKIIKETSNEVYSKIHYYINQIINNDINDNYSLLYIKELLNRLPYIIEYNRNNNDLFRFLCILSNHTRDYIKRLDQFVKYPNDNIFPYNSFNKIGRAHV